MRFLFACGGTAGHINPALGVAGRIKELLPSSEILFIGAEGKMEMDLVPLEGYEIRGVPVSNLSRSLSPEGVIHNFKAMRDLAAALPACRSILREFRPDVRPREQCRTRSHDQNAREPCLAHHGWL